MTDSERAATRRRLQIWQDAQPALEEQRWRELQALTEEQALRMSRALLGRRGLPDASRETSGLVEQQALFGRIRGR